MKVWPIALLMTAAWGVTAMAEPAATGAVSRGVGMVEAYQDLLKENLDLRNRSRTLEEQHAAARRDRERLEAGIRDLEKKLIDAAAALQKARDAQAAAEAEPAALQARVKTAEAERERLAGELAALQAKMAEASAAAPSGPAVAPGSDMYRKVEAERAALQQRVKGLEAERDAAAAEAASARAKIEALQAEFDQLQASTRMGASERDTMLKIVPHVRRLQERQRELEKQVAAREAERDASRKRADELEARVKDLTRLSNRLLAGEVRRSAGEEPSLDAEQPGAPTPDSGQTPPGDAYQALCRVGANLSDRAQARLAVKAYERALKMRPDAADAHYNLGILYEQDLHNLRKAIHHYSEYLRLAPHAADRDQVQAWLMEAKFKI